MSSGQIASGLMLRGVLLQQRRDFIGAERCYQTVLRERPDHSDALNLLGTLALEARKFDAAAALFRKALERDPKHPVYLTNLGSAYLQLRQHAAAAQPLEKAVESHPRLVGALLGLSQAYRQLNRPEEAMALARRAATADPTSTKAALALAGLLVNVGDTEPATTRYRALIAKGKDLPEVLAAMSTGHRFTADDPEPALMATLVAAPGLSEAARIDLMHALGKARADLGDHDGAFAAFSEAKTLSARSFDFAQTEQYYDIMRRELTAEFFAERRGFGLETERPVFIVGMPRSGTTLTEQICSSHSEVVGVGEAPSMSHIARQLGWRRSNAQQLADSIRDLTAEQSRSLAQAYLDDIAHYGPDGRRVIDKVPHNFEYLALVALLFPNARVIHCTRDPLDNCVSCFTHNFSEAHGYNGDLAVLGRYYRAYRQLMDHWRAVLPLRLHENSYEAMITDQETQSRTLIAFLGLDWEDAVLDFQRNDRMVLTPSRWQVRQPIYRTSVKSWEKYAAHLEPLFESLGDLAIKA